MVDYEPEEKEWQLISATDSASSAAPHVLLLSPLSGSEASSEPPALLYSVGIRLHVSTVLSVSTPLVPIVQLDLKTPRHT